jgi:hypothetical protein
VTVGHATDTGAILLVGSAQWRCRTALANLATTPAHRSIGWGASNPLRCASGVAAAGAVPVEPCGDGWVGSGWRTIAKVSVPANGTTEPPARFVPLDRMLRSGSAILRMAPISRNARALCNLEC